jgi:hypothetical protein
VTPSGAAWTAADWAARGKSALGIRREVLERGGNLAVQVFGGRLDGGGFPAVEAAFDALIAEHARASWFFGNVYDPADDATPLNWW